MTFTLLTMGVNLILLSLLARIEDGGRRLVKPLTAFREGSPVLLRDTPVPVCRAGSMAGTFRDGLLWCRFYSWPDWRSCIRSASIEYSDFKPAPTR